MKANPGWAAEIEQRVAALEKDAHPPIDLTPAIQEVLAEMGFTPELLDALRSSGQKARQ